jgi:hypothetical protein
LSSFTSLCRMANSWRDSRFPVHKKILDSRESCGALSGNLLVRSAPSDDLRLKISRAGG